MKGGLIYFLIIKKKKERRAKLSREKVHKMIERQYNKLYSSTCHLLLQHLNLAQTLMTCFLFFVIFILFIMNWFDRFLTKSDCN